MRVNTLTIGYHRAGVEKRGDLREILTLQENISHLDSFTIASPRRRQGLENQKAIGPAEGLLLISLTKIWWRRRESNPRPLLERLLFLQD